MPKLLLFAPCEKVIVANDNTISLLTIFEEMQINIPLAEEEKLPVNAQIPLKWFIFCLWQAEADEQKTIFEQLVEVTLPGDKAITGETTKIEFEKPHHRVITQLLVFPVTPSGLATISVKLRALPNENWDPIATYPLLIQRPD